MEAAIFVAIFVAAPGAWKVFSTGGRSGDLGDR